ncbi:hypothetical protein D3C81_2291710 [compost metagenome]
MPFDISIGVVNYIMFHLPEIGAATHNVQGIAHNVIQPFLIRVAAMAAIMHYIKSDQGERQSK